MSKFFLSKFIEIRLTLQWLKFKLRLVYQRLKSDSHSGLPYKTELDYKKHVKC